MAEGFGEAVKRLRTVRGWTQEELAREAGITGRFISSIENGSNVSLEVMAQIATALGKALPEMLAGEAIVIRASGEPLQRPANIDLPGDVIDFVKGFVVAQLYAEVACGDPIVAPLDDEMVIVRSDVAPDESNGEFLVRARGDSMVEYGIHDGWFVVVQRPEWRGVIRTNR